jgi:hypothetical protein
MKLRYTRSSRSNELTGKATKRKRHVRVSALLMKCTELYEYTGHETLLNTPNKTQHSRRFRDNWRDMGRKRHPSIHNHSKVFDLIYPFQRRLMHLSAFISNLLLRHHSHGLDPNPRCTLWS